jgi:hypothetical protein
MTADATTDTTPLATDRVPVPPHPARHADHIPPTAELVRSMTVHFAARSLTEQDAALGLLAVVLDEAPLGVAARVAAILWDVETAALDPLGVVELVARDLLVASQAGGDPR